MTSRNDQFVCFTAVLAVALPAMMWFRYVGPLRSDVAADERAVEEMRVTLGRHTEARLLPASESEQALLEPIRATREGIDGMMGRRPSVSEVYRGIEQAAAYTRLTVSRIEPSQAAERSEIEGPLDEYAIRVESRIFRIEIEGPAADLPRFVDGLSETLDHASVHEVRAQYAGPEGPSRSVTASVTLSSRSLTPVRREGSGT